VTRVLLTTLIFICGLGALAATVRWIVLSDSSRWSKVHRGGHARIDQRLVFPIAIFVDTLYSALGVATGANADYWLSFAILLVAQIILVVAILAAVGQKNRRRT
jgi:hypothetical protein